MAKNKLSENGERGIILFISSIAASEAQRGKTAYGSSKGALDGIVLPMARDLGKYAIRAVSIAAGIFDTPMKTQVPPNLRSGNSLGVMTPMNRRGDPKELAHFVKNIIENSYINGVSLRIDGAARLAHL